MRCLLLLLLTCLLAACAAPLPERQAQQPGAWLGSPAAAAPTASTVETRLPAPTTPTATPVATPPAAPVAATNPATDFFTAGPRAARQLNQAETAARTELGPRYELNFQDAEIRGVIAAVLGDMLKITYAVDPAVQGRITLRTGAPLTRDAVVAALESSLAILSFALVPEGPLLRVLPIEQAPQKARVAQGLGPTESPAPGYTIEIVTLRFVTASEMARLLEAFVQKGVVLRADDVHGHLVVAGTRLDRAAVLQVVERFDVDWLQGMNFALYKLEHSGVEQMVADLRQVFQPPLDLLTSRVRLVPLPRIRTVLGIARVRGDLELVDEWVRRLDRNQARGPRLWVYPVQHGVAKDIAAALRRALYGGGDGPVAPRPVGSGTAGSAVPETSAAGAAQAAGHLVAVEETNSILFYGQEEEFRSVREALRQIDVFPRQVMIEAVLAEVTLNDSLRYGVQWLFDSGENTMTLTTSDVGLVSPQFPGFSYLYTGRADARMVLNALQGKTEVRVLSSPKLLVMNNQKAKMQVGDQVPIVTQTSRGIDSSSAPIVNSVQLRDTGVILEVTPRVNDNGNVTLTVVQEVSDVAQTTSSGIDSPTIQSRRIETVVSTRDGHTVALGGLIRQNNTLSNSGVPWLKDLPLIGNLFRNTIRDARRTELIVLLVPHVMRSQQETQSVVDALVDGLDGARRVLEQMAPLRPGDAASSGLVTPAR